MEKNLAKHISIIFGLFCFLVGWGSLHAATLSFSPSSGSYSVGQEFKVTVLVGSPGQSVNAVSGTISFPSGLLEVTLLDKTASVMDLWVEEPSFSNTSGSINFEGVILNPGYQGGAGNILSIRFRAKALSTASVRFSSGQVLANNGSGTNVTESMEGAVYVIGGSSPQATTESLLPGAPLAPAVESVTHADPTKWYNDSDPQFAWHVPSDVTSVRLLYDENPVSVPTVEYTPTIGVKQLESIKDGSYYLHTQFKNKYGWGAINHFRFNIDTAPPSFFKITFPHGTTSPSSQPIIYFNTTDGLSGVDRYIVKVGEKEPLRVGALALSNPYVLPPQEPGSHTVLVQAFDKAGNSQIAVADFYIDAISPPEITVYEKVIQATDIIKIRGVTYPNASIDIFIRDGDGVIVGTDYTKSNSLGDFSVVLTKRLDLGDYSFTAQVTDAGGSKSAETEGFKFSVKDNFLPRLFIALVDYAGFTLITALIGIGMFGTIFYITQRMKFWKRKIRRDVENMDKDVHRVFHLLRESVLGHIRKLERAKSKRELTKEEEGMLFELRKSLDETEGYLSKEIKDIEDKLKS